MTNWLSRHRITVDEYYRLAEVGMLDPDARVELIEGEVIDMAPIGMSHNGMVDRLDRMFQRIAGHRAWVRCQGALRLSGVSEVVPDITLLRYRDDEYMKHHATARDALLVIEVSDTTLRDDLYVKVPLYARHGIPEVWIVDVENMEVQFHRSLVAGAYSAVSLTSKPGITEISSLPGFTVDLSKLLRT